MTTAPPTLINLQNRMVKNLGTVNDGIVGDQEHIDTGGYHIGAASLRAHGMGNDYSLTFALDRNATHDYACAADFGGSPEKLMLLGNRMKTALVNRDPRVYGKVRGINAPFDGQSDDRRVDDEDPNSKTDDNIQSSSDRGHIHLEVYRTLILNQSVMDGIYDVFAGVPYEGDDMSAAEVKAILDHLDDSQRAQSKEIRRVELIIINGRADDATTPANEKVYGLKQLSSDMDKIKAKLGIE